MSIAEHLSYSGSMVHRSSWVQVCKVYCIHPVSRARTEVSHCRSSKMNRTCLWQDMCDLISFTSLLIMFCYRDRLAKVSRESSPKCGFCRGPVRSMVGRVREHTDRKWQSRVRLQPSFLASRATCTRETDYTGTFHAMVFAMERVNITCILRHFHVLSLYLVPPSRNWRYLRLTV